MSFAKRMRSLRRRLGMFVFMATALLLFTGVS